MISGWRYRVVSVLGVVGATLLAVLIANFGPVQSFVTSAIPILDRLNPTVYSGGQLAMTATMTLVIVVAFLTPLYRPQPRRILNVVYHTNRRVLIAGLALATIGYFDWTFRLPRSTLIVTIGTLLVVLPVWFIAIRGRPSTEADRAIIIGDDPDEIDRILEAMEVPVLGYVSPPTPYVVEGDVANADNVFTDGAGQVLRNGRPSTDLPCLGGLSRFDSIIVENDVDTAVFAFNEADREEFFGVLATCHKHGVNAKIHREKADSVLVGNDPGKEIIDVDVEPWDWQDRLVKRAFDIAFSGFGLLAASPLLLVIALAIKMDSEGPVLYAQERTAEFGETFTVYKFRSMVTNAEAATGAKLSEEEMGGVDPRITRVGRVLRRTHLDEIPQLWSILVGDMSVVGPRPERPELDTDIELEEGVRDWRQRWFVKPGLTGLAQINGATGHEPEEKLRYDVKYIRRQSFRYDVAIVIRQLWQVFGDVVAMAIGRDE